MKNQPQHMLSVVLPFLPLSWLSMFLAIGPQAFTFICLVLCAFTCMPLGDAIANTPMVKLGLFGRLAGGSSSLSS